ncbi:MAG: tetratricopeptide repeat protein [Pseudomonadota bacterium]
MRVRSSLLAALLAALAGPAAAQFGDTAKAERCAIAIAGDVERDVILHCGMSRAELDKLVDRLVSTLDQRSAAREAEAAGVTRFAVIQLARRITVSVESVDQALIELDRAVGIAIKVQASGAGTGEDAFVDEVLRRLAALSADGQFDEAAEVADDAFAKWEREEAERQAEAKTRGIRLLQAGIDADLQRYAPDAAAAKIIRRVSLETTEPGILLAKLRAEQETWYVRGRDKGVALDLEVSIAISRRTLWHATTSHDRGTVQNDLAVSLSTLGERESGTARLEEAVDAYRAALEERTRDRVPLDWAMIQNNLGIALWTLGQRESGTARLEAAVAAFRATLEEQTRDRVPLDWAVTQNNLGNALLTLGQRESGTARLEEAVAAYRAALQERTRDRVPLQWAMTQNNLGTALETLGQRESGTQRLEEAVAAYRDALEERTRNRVPMNWAFTQGNLANVEIAWFDKTGEAARLDAAEEHVRAALEVFQEAGASHHVGMVERILASIEARRGKAEE